MATRSSVKTGPWSDPTTWDTGVPVDGDAATINGQHIVYFDVNQSSWVTGLIGLTIKGVGSGQPGCLLIDDAHAAAGTYCLAMAAGAFITGNDGALKPVIQAGTSVASPLSADRTFTIKWLGTTGYFQANYAINFKLYGTFSAHRYARLTADADVGATVLSVDTDLRSEWQDGDPLTIVNINKAKDIQRTTIAAGGIGASSLTIANALDSRNIVGAYVLRVACNVILLVPGPQHCVVSPAAGSEISCLVRSVAGGGSGTGLYYPTGVTFYGICDNFITPLSPADRTICTRDSILVGDGGGGITSSTRAVFLGMILGGTTGIVSDQDSVVSGVIAGCNDGLTSARGTVFQGAEVFGCTRGLTTGFFTGRALKMYGNSYDIVDPCGCNPCWGSSFRSTTQVSGYKASAGNLNPYDNWTTVLYDVGDVNGAPQPGKIKSWMPGGTIASVDWVQGTHGTPPSPLAFLHEHTCEDATKLNYVDIPLYAVKDVPLSILVYIRSPSILPSAMTQAPKAEIIDPDKAFLAADECVDAVNASKTMADDLNWQTLTLTYTPTADRVLILRVSGKNASGVFWWNYAIETTASGGKPQIGSPMIRRVA